MKALVLTENGVLSSEERPRPEPFAPDQILVRVSAVGICGSDIPRAFEGKSYHYPLVLGHEFSGTVEDNGGSDLSAGDPVVVFPLLPRREDPYSVIGEYAVSSGYDYYGSRRDGGMQEYLWVPRSSLLRVPPGVSLVDAAMTEPAAVALHGVNKVVITPAASALVIGGGPIGAMVAQFLRIRGCVSVFVAETDEKKRAILNNLGFDTIDPRQQDTVEAIFERTGGRGADCVVEAVGLPVTFEQSFRSCATFGQIVLLGNISGSLTLDEKQISSILRKELTIHGTWNSKVTPIGSSEWDEVLLRLGSTLQVAPLISHTVPLEEASGIMRQMYQRSIWFNKVMITMEGRNEH